MERITRHIGFSPPEDALIVARAASVGLPVVAYIRHQALVGRVKGYDLSALTSHSVAIEQIVQAVRTVSVQSHEDRWLYQADLEHIQKQLDELLEIEREIVRNIQKVFK